jgi:dolichol-phosphate mannosyltransferase
LTATKLSLVIPYYNDEGCPAPFVKELKKMLGTVDYELILVDDCSTDTTPEELDGLEDERTRAVHNEKNRDYGGAIQAGLRLAKGDIVAFTCGDGEVTPEEVVNVLRKMNDWEVVKAVRLKRKDGWIRIVITNAFNILSEFRFRLGLRDINGYPVFMKKEVYTSLGEIREDWLFNLDLYRKIKKNNIQIQEVPILHRTRLSGKSHMTPARILKMISSYLSFR